MNDLRVESYNTKEVVDKKRLITKRAAMAGGTVLLTLGLFGLVGCEDVNRAEERPAQIDEQYSDVEEYTDVEEQIPMPAGGFGAWYISVLERAQA